jgi:hypothetical protein
LEAIIARNIDKIRNGLPKIMELILYGFQPMSILLADLAFLKKDASPFH